MSNLTYKKLIYNESAILNLYVANKWYAYTNDKESLFKGIRNSLDVIGVYDEELLVGLIRTIGDKETIVFIQDILVLPAYQRKGIGTKLLQLILEKYKNVRQISLHTDETLKTRKFYQSMGFEDLTKIKCVGFTYNK